MALQEIQIAIPFGQGVDTKSDPKRVAPMKLRALENGVFTKSGTIAKRTGYTALPAVVDSGGAYSSPKSLATRDGELLLFAGDKLYSYRDSSSSWSKVGHAESIVHTETPIARTGTQQTGGDAATSGGVTVIAWEDSRGGVWWSIVESASGRVLRPASQLASGGSRPRVLAVGAVIHVYYADVGSGRLWCAVINPGAYLATIVPVVLAGDLSAANPSYDAVATTRTGTPAALAWARDIGGYRIGYVDQSGVLGSAVTGHPGVATWADTITGAIAVTWDATAAHASGSVSVAWVNSTTTSYRIVQAGTLTASVATAAIAWTHATAMVRVALGWQPGAGQGGGRDLWIFGEEPAATDRDSRVWIAYVERDGSHAGTTLAAPVRGHGLASSAFHDGAAGLYVIIAHEVPFFPYAALLRVYTDSDAVTIRTATVGRFLTGVGAGLPRASHLPGVEVDATDARIHRWIGAYREQVDALAVSDDPATPAVPQFTEVGLKRVIMDFDHADAFRSAQLGRDLVIGGALAMRYDGDSLAELSFHSAPDGTITTTPSAGGSMTASSTYLYAYCYEETDAQGEIHPGPFSVGTLVSLAAGETRVTHTIPTYRLTGKRNVRIGVFRSEANDTNTVAPTLYRVSSLDPSASTGSNRYVSNDVTADTVTFVDDMSDAAILTKERAYVSGGVLSNDPSPLGAFLAAGKNRIIASDPTQPLGVRFTQERRDGFGPEPCADLFTTVDPYGGPVVAVAVLDDKVIVFKENAIHMFTGPGPLANPDDPNSQGFSPPQLVTSDVGCTSAPSIAVTPLGLVFQSAKGIHLLDRGLNVSYIGADVEAYNAQRITHAALLPGRQHILFLAETGKSLLFDYQHKQWSTYTNHTGASGVLVDGVYHYLRTDGSVFREATSSYRDQNQQIRLALETAWIHLADYLQGWQWFYYLSVIGTYKGSHTLRVRLRLDYESGWGEPYNLDVSSNYNPADYGEGSYGSGVYGGSADTHETRYQRQIHIGGPGQAISVRIEDVELVAPLGDSYDLAELLLTGGMIAPKAFLGPSRRS